MVVSVGRGSSMTVAVQLESSYDIMVRSWRFRTITIGGVVITLVNF